MLTRPRPRGRPMALLCSRLSSPSMKGRSIISSPMARCREGKEEYPVPKKSSIQDSLIRQRAFFLQLFDGSSQAIVALEKEGEFSRLTGWEDFKGAGHRIGGPPAPAPDRLVGLSTFTAGKS